MNKIEIYKLPDNQIELQVNLENETVWLSQKQMAELFGKDTDTIGLHLKNIFLEKELLEKSTTGFFPVVQTEGKRKVSRNIKYYNLDAIISVGYRVNSKRGTQFRQWATQRLKDYLVKGYAINEKSLQEMHTQLTALKETFTQNEYHLTPKELKVLELMSKGYLYKEIANELNNTSNTIKQHIHHIYEKLHVQNKAEAINKIYLK